MDCVGVIVWAFEIRDSTLPRYRLCDGSWPKIEDQVVRWFDPQESGLVTPVLLVTQRPRCFHFAVGGRESFVHADLRLRKIVETPLSGLDGPTRCYRRKEA